MHLTIELLEIPLLRELGDAVGEHRAFHRGRDRLDRFFAELATVEDLLAAPVDHLALLVHHLVVLEHVLADLEVAVFDGALRALDRAGDHLRFERHVVGERLPHHPVHRAGREQAHEIVFERQVEPALAGIALPAGAATELVVDAPALVALGAEHVEAAELTHLLAVVARTPPRTSRPAPRSVPATPRRWCRSPAALGGRALRVAAEQDVDAAAGHVGGDGDAAEAAGLGDDVRLPLVLLRVQHLVRDPALLEHAAEQLRLLDRDRADQHRLALGVAFGDVVGDGVELGHLGLVDEVGLVVAHHRAVGGDRHDLEPVRVRELARLRGGGAGHARELVVHAEVVLERDRGEGLVLFLDLHPLLGLDRLVEAFAPTATLEDAAGELVDDLHLAVLHHVVDVALEQLLGAQRRLELVDEVLVDVLVEVVDAERLPRPAATPSSVGTTVFFASSTS